LGFVRETIQVSKVMVSTYDQLKYFGWS